MSIGIIKYFKYSKEEAMTSEAGLSFAFHKVAVNLQLGIKERVLAADCARTRYTRVLSISLYKNIGGRLNDVINTRVVGQRRPRDARKRVFAASMGFMRECAVVEMTKLTELPHVRRQSDGAFIYNNPMTNYRYVQV